MTGSPTAEIVRRGITMVPENRRLFADMTVDENLTLGAYLRTDGGDRCRDRERVLETFPRIRERLNRRRGRCRAGSSRWWRWAGP